MANPFHPRGGLLSEQASRTLQGSPERHYKPESKDPSDRVNDRVMYASQFEVRYMGVRLLYDYPLDSWIPGDVLSRVVEKIGEGCR